MFDRMELAKRGVGKTGFFGPLEKKSRTIKLKLRDNNSKVKQKTQYFGKF